jgi:hypothetical protein
MKFMMMVRICISLHELPYVPWLPLGPMFVCCIDRVDWWTSWLSRRDTSPTLCQACSTIILQPLPWTRTSLHTRCFPTPLSLAFVLVQGAEALISSASQRSWNKRYKHHLFAKKQTARLVELWWAMGCESPACYAAWYFHLKRTQRWGRRHEEYWLEVDRLQCPSGNLEVDWSK